MDVMGGLGSGRWTRLERQALTDQYQGLDVRQMRRDGWLISNTRVTFQSDYGTRILSIYDDRLLVQEGGACLSISLIWRPCNLGGKRPVLLCPDCAQPAYILYHRWWAYSCRRCAQLSYASQYENAYLRSISRANRTRAKIDSRNTLMFPIPAKPKGMHEKTYQRLVAQALLNEGKTA